MLITLALRNVLRNLRRLAPMMFSLVLVFTLLIAGNAVLSTTIDALYGVYAQNITGDLTVSAAAEDNYTVFGSDQLLVGQYLIPPTIVDYKRLKEITGSWPEVRVAAGLVTSAARVELGGQKKTSTVFGVDFEEYTDLVSELKLVAGSFPGPGQPGIVVQAEGWGNADELIGSKVLLASALGLSFTLREVPLTGVISYPVADSMLERVVLVDADTARSLNGYLYGSDDVSISDEEMEVLDSDFNSMFETAEESAGPDVDSVLIDPQALFSDEEQAELKPVADKGAWNFLLLSLHSRNDTQKVSGKLASEGFKASDGYLVRDWSASVGGNARLASFLQILFNIGLIFISFGAVIIVTNALLLSVLERTGEIGTLRAIGAARLKISLMIFIETLVVVFGSAIIGIIAGMLGIEWLNSADIHVNNQYISILFGGEAVRGRVTLSSIAVHLAAAFVFTILSMLYPLKKALGIQPVEAMAE